MRMLTVSALFLLPASLLGQSNVTGHVSDPSGASVAGAKIVVTSGGKQQAGISDASGNFQVQHVASGSYRVHVDAINGFTAYDRTFTVGRIPVHLLITLRIDSVAQEIVVAPEPDAVSLDNGNNRDQISADAALLQSVPVFDQNFVAALTPFLDQNTVGTGGVTIMVDGVERKTTGVSASAISEVRINSDPYSVETRQPGRGRIDIITKPGTPRIHGSLNFTFRDSVTDAKNYFATTRPFEQKRIYEGSITGPAALDHHTTFLLSGSRQEDNLQSIVHAVLPSGTFDANVPTPMHDTEFAARVSHDFSDANRVSFQYNVSDVVTRNLGVGGLVLPDAGTNQRVREDDVIFTQRIIITPSLLNQLQLFYEQDYGPTRSATNAPKVIVDGNFTGGGAQADALQNENNLKINDTVSWTHGRHYVTFGVNIPNLSRRAWHDDTNRLGTFSFASLGDYESGHPYSYTQQAGPGRSIFWMNELGAFIQDQLQVSKNLQVSFGLRYDWQTYFKAWNDFGPRASFAYRLKDAKTVLRGGLGMFFDRSGAAPEADLNKYNGVTLRAVTLLNPGYPNPYPTRSDIYSYPTNLVTLEPGGRVPYAVNYSLTLERQLMKGLTFAATYRGTQGIALLRSRNVNAPVPPQYSVVLAPAVGIVRQLESKGRQIGNTLDLTVQGKAGRWFSGMLLYTLSRTNNDTGGVTWFPANQYSMAGEYGRSDLDQRHRFNMLGSFNRDHWLNLGVAVKLYSALPYTETAGVDRYNTGLLNARPDGISRNTLRGGRVASLDVHWSKEAELRLKNGDVHPKLNFSVDAFNVTNTASFTSFVGNIRSTLFSQPTTAMQARRVQFGTGLTF
ncbi:carboxypeptidase regulatory-like domain-containing protein [Terriglobus sp. TAA 43]|uniref:TonB-dependent receptor n=1 Tax=Terriglobus sp. TAA 43 TaxID=278961 RepID=UPI000648C0D2|nr:carboxypeptidase regulatory-like domain-containing protein [Terriglobus sp. TAA 43]